MKRRDLAGVGTGFTFGRRLFDGKEKGVEGRDGSAKK